MNRLIDHPCSECEGELVSKPIAQEFERGGVRVKLSGVQAWVCQRCGEVYFAPGGADLVNKAVNSLFALAAAGHQHRGELAADLSN